jgi:hypothetical protein
MIMKTSFKNDKVTICKGDLCLSASGDFAKFLQAAIVFGVVVWILGKL